jgi:hypothetical protein
MVVVMVTMVVIIIVIVFGCVEVVVSEFDIVVRNYSKFISNSESHDSVFVMLK